jgi:hypothetical protein
MSPTSSMIFAMVRLSSFLCSHHFISSITWLIELGILVWQDFQFACGVYPVHQGFVASVKREAEANVTRLRRHPSIVLWCGNNEDYQQVFQWDLKGDNPLPAVKIYEDILPGIVEELTHSQVPYWRGSPYGGKGWDTADPRVGDVVRCRLVLFKGVFAHLHLASMGHLGWKRRFLPELRHYGWPLRQVRLARGETRELITSLCLLVNSVYQRSPRRRQSTIGSTATTPKDTHSRKLCSSTTKPAPTSVASLSS